MLALFFLSQVSYGAMVQFANGGRCLVASSSAEHAGLALGSCGAKLAAWDDAPDARGHPQLALAASAGALCVNDDSVKCAPGNALILHACQRDDAHIHTANWFVFDAATGHIATNDFCPGMCLGAVGQGGPGQVHLSACTDKVEALVFSRSVVPPTPPPPPFLPTPSPTPPTPPPTPATPGTRPNIVFFLTDDQDQLLGGSFPPRAPNGATPMPMAMKHLVKQGTMATNHFIHTPVCCPSRAETLTGRYLHNVKVPVAAGQCGAAYDGHDDLGNVCCMHVDEALVNNHTFARVLKEQGAYRVGMFGKYLNVCPASPVPGFDAWFANGGGTYYAPQFFVHNVAGLPDGSITFNASDYSTALIGNFSTRWIRQVATDGSGDPWFAYIGTKACHDPFHPAPWYNESWDAAWPAGAPRPGGAWNASSSSLAGHHPTIAARPPFGTKTAACIDNDFKNRWRTLMSVDDIIGAVFDECETLGVMNNTVRLCSLCSAVHFDVSPIASFSRSLFPSHRPAPPLHAQSTLCTPATTDTVLGSSISTGTSAMSTTGIRASTCCFAAQGSLRAPLLTSLRQTPT